MRVLREHAAAGGPGTAPCSIILVQREHQFDPFVVWYRNYENPERPWNFQGRYFLALQDAEAEFTRCLEREQRIAKAHGWASIPATYQNGIKTYL